MRIQSVMDITDASNSYSRNPGPAERRLPFYLQAVGSFYARRHYLTEREGYASYLLLYTLNGCGIVEQNRRQIDLPVNHAVLLDCREPHRYATAPNGTGGSDAVFWNFCYIHLDGCGVSPYYERLNGRSLCGRHLPDSSRAQLLDDFTTLFEWTGQPAPPILHRDLQISVLLQQILAGLAALENTADPADPAGQYDSVLDHILDYLVHHYQEPINLDQLAVRANLSKYHFCRLFRAYTGQSPYAWLIGYRIGQSKKLLRESRISIQEIAGRTGFGDTNHFIRTFRTATGATPRRYRQENWLI
ncbi:MAG: AraC family transcriptional regulator [Clostridiaceae bacterium]|nr:AraC family transcriptional regulator [Clostridiaceae bacterium]